MFWYTDFLLFYFNNVTFLARYIRTFTMRQRSAKLILSALSVFVFFAQSAYAQNKEMLFSSGEVLIADEPLPSKVFNAQKNVLKIIAGFYSKDDANPDSFIFLGSGFVEKNSGLVVTARHLLVEPLFSVGQPHVVNGDLVSKYAHDFYAIVERADSLEIFPLFFVAMSKLDTYGDVMLLRPTNKNLNVNPLELDLNASLGDTVYTSGFTAHYSNYYDLDGKIKNVLVDEIKFNFRNKISAIKENQGLAAAGVSRIYRMVDHAQGGFSGGPVLNDQGRVIGITIEVNGAFVYAMSARDILNLISSLL
ncbi:MAG: hypothetical protein A2750_03590 [Candidatus Yanofskybacteria bacterium RIFCSPHIGHO2_01_FULL_45_42]|uniref:Serine protease n=1 Tax=Candidatus Yanofskybacteria bacterium RIFCSPHIGHO2_01_FULL_45_42 TaxID=1802671 RepID=A0A1F8F0X9_9BACT|nr:MAG: hypothetical protein A2750_03590 [Candidatus Yanofskybacteria bacterium RIFCSPHIGHO2_01_FULL_45_42]